LSRECPTCKPIRCCEEDLLAYEITSGTVYFNTQQSVDFVCPPGFSCVSGIYTTPAGRFRLVVNPNPTEPTLLRLQCCESEIVRTVTPQMSADEIGVIAQNMVDSCARQSARCQGNQTVVVSFRNTRQCVTVCPPGKLLGYTGSPPPVGNGYSISGGQLCIAAGLYSSSVSVAQANIPALAAVTARANALVSGGTLQCGYWNTEQVFICEDLTTITVPAFTFFSTVSQADADALAMANAEAQCGPLCNSGVLVRIIGYTDAMFDNPGQNGTLIGTFEFTQVLSPFLGSTWYKGNVEPDDLATWEAMQLCTAVTNGGNTTRIGNLESADPESYSQCLFGGCFSGETVFDQVGQTLSFYDGATTQAGLFTNPWDGQFTMTGGVGECASFTAPSCIGIAGQLGVVLTITDASPFVFTIASGATVIWEGSSTDIQGPYTRTGGTSAIPADLSIEPV
jgi:hypothetical protein